MLRRSFRSSSRRHSMIRRREFTEPVSPTEARVPRHNGRVGGRSAIVPQAYYDQVETEAHDPVNHPSLGTYTATATKSGNWSDPTVWDIGMLPGPGAIVDIGPNAINFDIEMSVADAIEAIHVPAAGTFTRDTTKDTCLYIDTLFSHGTCIFGQAGDATPESVTLGKVRARTIFKRVQDPLTTTRFGFVSMGTLRILGVEKQEQLSAPFIMSAGATTITLSGVAESGWRVGDIIVVIATTYSGATNTDPTYSGPTSYSITGIPAVHYNNTAQGGLGFYQTHDEPRVIVAIDGNTITLGPAIMPDGSNGPVALQYNHTPTVDTLPDGTVVTVLARVSNLSCSVMFESYRPDDDINNTHLLDRQNRAHMMLMHSDKVDVRFFRIHNMARTDTGPTISLGGTSPVTSGGNSVEDLTNVKGRYAFHLHNLGAYFGREQANVIGMRITGQIGVDMTAIPTPGWAGVQHGSRAAFERCVFYNTRGAALVSELGNEIGQWIKNIAIWTRGYGFEVNWDTMQELLQNANGNGGSGFENQARQILQQGNINASAHFGWVYLQQVKSMLSRIPDIHSLRLFDPVTMGGNHLGDGSPYDQDSDTYGIEQAQIPDFNDNLCFNTDRGLFISHRAHTDRTETTPLIGRRNHCIATRRPLHLSNYSFFYSFYDTIWHGIGSHVACALGEVSWQWVFVNFKLKDFGTGFRNDGMGFNYNGDWINLEFENVATPFIGFTADWDISAWKTANPTGTFPQDHALYGLMGPWITNTALSEPTVPNKWVGTLREWKAITTADLPVNYPAAPRGPGGIEPAPGTPKPYIVWDNTDVVLSDVDSISLRATIVDNVGVRYWPDWFSSESFGPSTTSIRPTKKNVRFFTATKCAINNGCFDDNGTWKSRLWFVEHDRLTGEYFVFSTDVTLSGVSPEVLAANVVDPNSTKPQLPLLPEEVGPPTVAPPYVPPVVEPQPEPEPSNLWTPAEISSSLQGWISADDSTMTMSGALVAQADNIVPTGGTVTHFAWDNDAERVELVTLASGEKAFRFDMVRNTIMRALPKIPAPFSNLMVFIVVNPFSTTASSNRFVSYADNDTDAVKQDWNSSGSMAVLTQWSTNNYTHTTQNSNSNTSRVAYLDDEFCIMGTVMRSRVTFTTVNGVRSNTWTIPEGQLASGYFNIGRQGMGGNPLDGHIREVVLATQNMSDTNIWYIEGYLAHKYGLAGKLPSGHLYKTAAPLKA